MKSIATHSMKNCTINRRGLQEALQATSDKGSLIVADYGSDGSEGTSSVRPRPRLLGRLDRLPSCGFEDLHNPKIPPDHQVCPQRERKQRGSGERRSQRADTARVSPKRRTELRETPRNEDKIEKLQGSAKRCFLGCVNSIRGSTWL